MGDEKTQQAGQMLIHLQFACWGQRPQTPLNSSILELAARSCGTLFDGLRPGEVRKNCQRSSL